MNMFVCEFITGGGMQDAALPSQLVREGDMMLSALLDDLHDAGMQNLLCTRDPRLPVSYSRITTITADHNIWDTWYKCMRASAVAWIIAPETDGILYELTRMAHTAGCMVIGCTPEAVQLTASKAKTINHLAFHNIPCVPLIDYTDTVADSRDGWVVKPDDGVSAEGCLHFRDLRRMLAYTKSRKGKLIIQQYIPGIAASMSILCHAGQARLLASNRQLFRFKKGRGRLSGVVVNGLPEFAGRFLPVAKDIARSLPGLNGYVGVDFVITDQGPLVIEINPRLTTAYAGLRRSLGMNPAEWILSTFTTGQLPEIPALTGTPVTISI